MLENLALRHQLQVSLGTNPRPIVRIIAGGELVRYKRPGSTATFIYRKVLERRLRPRPPK